MGCRAGASVRLLPVRTVDVCCGAAEQKAETNGCRYRQRNGWQYLPMRNLSTDPPRDSPRGRRLREGNMSKTLTRRNFLKVSAAGGALLVGGYIPGLRETETAEAAGVFAPNVWVKITPDDTVTIMLSQLEMGQGVMTSMPMLLAEELDVDFTRI